MERTLCFDFGNTRLKCAVFAEELEDVIVLPAGDVDAIEAVLDKYRPVKTILSSVIAHDIAIEELLAKKTKFHKLGASSKLPVIL